MTFALNAENWGWWRLRLTRAEAARGMAAGSGRVRSGNGTQRQVADNRRQ